MLSLMLRFWKFVNFDSSIIALRRKKKTQEKLNFENFENKNIRPTF